MLTAAQLKRHREPGVGALVRRYARAHAAPMRAQARRWTAAAPRRSPPRVRRTAHFLFFSFLFFSAAARGAFERLARELDALLWAILADDEESGSDSE